VPRSQRARKRIFVLDTNVLIHDPDGDLPLRRARHLPADGSARELDSSKKGLSEQARNARQASRFLDQIMQGTSKTDIDAASRCPRVTTTRRDPGAPRTSLLPDELAAGPAADTLPGNRPDNTILANTLALRNEQPHARVTLVSKDINLRIKAAVLGIHAEDYYNDRTLADIDVLYTGVESSRPTSGTSTGRICRLGARTAAPSTASAARASLPGARTSSSTATRARSASKPWSGGSRTAAPCSRSRATSAPTSTACGDTGAQP
jgi:predicted ribonuclease YlaK